MPPKVLFIQQDHVSPTGPVGAAFAANGYRVEEFLVVPPDRFADPGVTVTFPDPTDYDAIVPMGAPWSVYDKELIGTWIDDELALLRRADEAGIPVLGICFGGQALAAAHGGTVERAPRPEIGWHTIESDDPDLVPTGPWFEWHFDRWTLPPGARELARTDVAPQAFLLRRNLAVQFHPELTGHQLELWLDNGGATQLPTHGLDPDEIRRLTATHEPDAVARATHLVTSFLTHVHP